MSLQGYIKSFFDVNVLCIQILVRYSILPRSEVNRCLEHHLILPLRLMITSVYILKMSFNLGDSSPFPKLPSSTKS